MKSAVSLAPHAGQQITTWSGTARSDVSGIRSDGIFLASIHRLLTLTPA